MLFHHDILTLHNSDIIELKDFFSVLVIKPTFKQIEEEPLSVCDLNDALLIWCCFVLHFLLVIFAQEIQGVPHAEGVAETQALVELAKVFGAGAHFVVSVQCRCGSSGFRMVLPSS